MRYDLQILRAVFRLSKHGEERTLQALLAAAGGTPAKVRASLRVLEREGWITRAAAGEPRLTMAGLSLAVAAAPPPRQVARAKRVGGKLSVPLARRAA